MKIINLDTFRPRTRVIIDGKEYTIKGVTVGLYIEDGDVLKDIDAMDDNREKIGLMIDFLGKVTDIPVEILLDQDFERLYALIAISQGLDPTEQKTSGTEGRDGKK